MAKKEVSNTTENKLSNSIFKTSRGQKFIVGVLFVIIAIILWFKIKDLFLEELKVLALL